MLGRSSTPDLLVSDVGQEGTSWQTSSSRPSTNRSAKATLKFPLSKPIPHDLIERVVALHVEQRRDGTGSS